MNFIRQIPALIKELCLYAIVSVAIIGALRYFD